MKIRLLLKGAGAQLDATRHLALWNAYFLAKFYLFATGAVNFDLRLNLLLLLFALLPVGARLQRSRSFALLRSAAGLLLALALLWYDSWLPSLSEAINLLKEYGIPSFSYLSSFFGRVVSMSLLGSFVLLLLASYLLGRHRRLSIAVLALGIAGTPLLGVFNGASTATQLAVGDEAEAAEKDPGKYLDSFYSKESERAVVFRHPSAQSVPFDVVVLHVCSMSWDDLKQVGVTPEDPFFRQFDYLFTDFNSVTGYSGPAALRLLQSNGGQRSNSEIHSDSAPKEYFLFQSLADLGYERYIAMDHDGKYGNFNTELRKNGMSGAHVIGHDSLSPAAVFFDGKTNLYRDDAVFSRWLEARNRSNAARAALYYNTVLMHAGTHWVRERKWSGRDPREQYKEMSTVAFKEIGKMIELLKAGKRNTVLVLVAEHGRALTGSAFQPPDIRDVPLPKITRVPMAVKLIGPKFASASVKPAVVSKPTSYFALSWLLSKFEERSPFGPGADAPAELAAKVPKTEFVSENEGNKIVEIAGVYYYLGKSKKWMALTPAQLK